MITLSDFQNHLSHKAPLKQPSHQYINGQEQQLLKWAASLPAQTEAQQAIQLQQVLTELAVTELDDELRLKLLSIVVCASDRLITSLHKHYNYELGALNEEQLAYIDQVESLYYLTNLAYDDVIKRESLTLNYQQSSETGHGWKQFLTLPKMPPLILAAAIYQSLITYQKLLYEQDISYQQPLPHLWAAFNELYHLACQVNVAHTDLSAQVVTRQALSIHDLYVQICLHSLLNVRAMRRPNILLIQRLLSLWSAHVHATIEPQSETRIFVDLQNNKPPDYLTANSNINPYEDHHRCLFIDLEPLAAYLHQRQQTLLDGSNTAIEYQLVNKVLMAINHRYIERQMVMPTKYSSKQGATIISGFNNIHYEVAGAHSLMSMIAAKELPIEQLPRYDTQPKKDTVNIILDVETFDSANTTSQFRALRLLRKEDSTPPQTVINDKAETQQPSLRKTIATAAHTDALDRLDTAPPPLRLMNLFLLCRPNTSSELKWSVGMVRWLNLENRHIEVEWQIFGHVLTACALRLDIRDHRGQGFMPALMIAGDKDLQTEFTIIVPPHHFQSNDKVMLRINDKQKTLCLQQCLINCEEFSQYKVVQI